MYELKPKYENEEPINDMFEALELLRQKRRENSKIQIADYVKEGFFLEVEIFSSGYGGEEYTCSRYYRITQELLDKLKQFGYVKGTPHWGYTDENELHISEFGTTFFNQKLWEYEDLIIRYLFFVSDSGSISISGKELLEISKLPRRTFVAVLRDLYHWGGLVQVGEGSPVAVWDNTFEKLRFRIKPKTDSVEKEK